MFSSNLVLLWYHIPLRVIVLWKTDGDHLLLGFHTTGRM